MKLRLVLRTRGMVVACWWGVIFLHYFLMPFQFPASGPPDDQSYSDPIISTGVVNLHVKEVQTFITSPTPLPPYCSCQLMERYLFPCHTHSNSGGLLYQQPRTASTMVTIGFNQTCAGSSQCFIRRIDVQGGSVKCLLLGNSHCNHDVLLACR